MNNQIKGLIREPHDMSDLISALSKKDNYIHNTGSRDEAELLSQLKNYLKSKYRDNYYKGDYAPEEIAETKAEAILGLDNKPRNSKIESLYKPKNLSKKRPIERFNEVILAMKSGQLSEIKLNFPWHPKIFWDENLPTTFPFQHTSAILYTGQPKHIFFCENGKKFLFEKYDQPRNPQSILVQGSLRGGDKYGNHGNEKAVYMGSLSTAQGYPMENDDDGILEGIYRNSPILEVQVPTNRLRISRGGDNPESVKDMERIFSTPEEFLKECKKQGSLSDFMLTQRDGDLPLENIVGVWDREYSSDIPHFIPLNQYYNFLRRKYPDRLPEPEEIVLNVQDLETPEYDQEIRKVIRFEKLLEKIPKITPLAHKIKTMNGTILRNQSDIQNFVSDLKMLPDYVETYDQELEKLRSVVQENFKQQDINWKSLEFVNFAKDAAQSKYIMKEEELQRRIQETGNKHINENMNKEELTIVKKELIEELGQLPILNLNKKELVQAGIFLTELEKSNIGKKQLEKILLEEL